MEEMNSPDVQTARTNAEAAAQETNTEFTPADETPEPKQYQSRKPDFTAREGAMAWKNKIKTGQHAGKEYISLKIPLLDININLFPTE